VVVAVKVPNPKAAGSKSSRVQVLAHYIAQPQTINANEKCVYLGTREFLSQHFESQVAEMLALASECVKSKDPIRHDVISFKEGESPTPDQVEEIIDLYLKEMGLVGHQCIYGLHADTDDIHIHIQVNRVHPDTLKAVKTDRGFDKEALQRVCARIEHAQGWKPENNSRYHIQADGSISDRPVRSETTRKPSKHAQDMETRTGIKSAERIVIDDATSILKNAKTWEEVHDRLEAVGIQYQRQGSGAVMVVGDVSIKASAVERGARFSALQKKLGPFEPKGQEKKNEYFIHDIDSERDAQHAGEKEQDFGDAQYLAANGLRRLSKCSLAISSWKTEKRASVLSFDARTCRRQPSELRRPEAARSGVDRSKEPLDESLYRKEQGWNEYAKARREYYKNRRLETEATRQRHAQEREALKAQQRVERTEALPTLGPGESRAGMTNVLRSLMKFEQAKAKLNLKDRHAAERAALKLKYPQFPSSYEQWLIDQGKIENAQAWRYHTNPDDEPCTIRGFGSLKPAHGVDIRDFTGSVEGYQVRYTNASGHGFVDKGRIVVIADWRDEGVTLAALQLSAQKWGSFTVTGNEEYKAMCCKLAAVHGFKINNPELQSAIHLNKDLLNQERQAQQAEAQKHVDAPTVEVRSRSRGGYERG